MQIRRRCSIGLCLAAASCADRAPGAALADGRHALTGYVVVRAADCDSHLQLLRELRRTDWHGRIGVGGVVLVGAPSESTTVRRAMRSYDVDGAIVVPGDARFRALAATLRPRAMAPPSLVLVDRAGQLVLAESSPSTHDQTLALRRSVARALSQPEPTPNAPLTATP